jgi:hypothetical protein
MKQIFSPFQPLECFEVDGVDYLCLDYQIIQDWEDKLVEQFSWFKFKRLRDHKHYEVPITKIIQTKNEGRAKLCKCK